MTISARLRHRVAIQEKVETQDSETGDISFTWVPVDITSSSSSSEPGTVPAEVLTGPGREMYAAGTKQAETTARITMRWFPGLLPTMRIVWGDQVYNILSIETDATGRREYRVRVRNGVSDGD